MGSTLSPELALQLEWASVAGNIAFTILIALERRSGWLFGFVAAVIGVLLYAVLDAWLMAALNGFYAFMGLYGWWTWGRSDDGRISTMSWRQHAVVVALGLASTCALFALMHAIGMPGKYLWMEAYIASFAILATWLMSRKALENWIYWTVGDLVAVIYNHWVGYDGYALLNVIYVILAIAGFIRWRRQMLLSVT